jgi:hypothetical protein
MDSDPDRVEFKSADDLLLWVWDCHAAGESVARADDPRLREVGFIIPGVYGYARLETLREHPCTRKALARFQPIPDWVWDECKGNLLLTCKSRDWVARRGRGA